jgi:hypothetical protein
MILACLAANVARIRREYVDDTKVVVVLSRRIAAARE